jgi:hypothetical protein
MTSGGRTLSSPRCSEVQPERYAPDSGQVLEAGENSKIAISP